MLLKRVPFFIVFVFAGVFLGLAAPVQAQTGITVSPGLLELSTYAGGTPSASITISNTGGKPVIVQPTVMDYSKKTNGTVTIQAPKENETSCARWVDIATKKLELKPGETINLKTTYKTPGDVNPGVYRAVVLFNVSTAGKGGVAIGGRVGTIISLKINPSEAGGNSNPLLWGFLVVSAVIALVVVFTSWLKSAGRMPAVPSPKSEAIK
jgi:hypothetical protein